VKDRLGTLIQDEYQLSNLLQILTLTETYRTQILDAMKNQLGNLIKSGYQLHNVLQISTLTETQRTQILDAVKDRLDTLIQDGDHLSRLLRISTLTETQRTQIWDASKELRNVTPSGISRSSGFFNLPNGDLENTHNQSNEANQKPKPGSGQSSS
ncbi:MAG: hypothetical protein ACD_45C00079G0001, partial [uncultured bacterium]